MAYYEVTNGQTSHDTVLNNNDSMYIYDGMAEDTTVNSGGEFNIYESGIARNTTVADGGIMTVESGAVETVLVEEGGAFTMYGATGVASGLVLNGGSAVVKDGRIFGGTVRGGGSMMLSNFGSAEDMSVLSGTVALTKQGYFNGTIDKGGVVVAGSDAVFYDTTVSSGGKVSFAAAHTVDWNTLTFEDGGIMDFDISGVAPDGGVLVDNYSAITGTPVCTITISGTQAVGTYKLASDAYGFYNQSITVQNKAGAGLGALTVDGDPVDIGDSNYTLSVDNQFVLTLTVASGSWKVITGDVTSETKNIEDGFLASGVNVNTSGWLFIHSGGIASETTVNDHGIGEVSSGGTADIVTVNPGGGFFVNSGGTALQILENGGYVYAGNGAEVTFISNTLSGTTLTKPATLHSCTTANEVTISSGGTLYVSAGGSANNAGVLSSGLLAIISGGFADSAVVKGGGGVYVSSGGTATNVIWTPCEGYVFAEPDTTVTYVSKYSGVYFGSNGRMVSHADVMDAPRIGAGNEAYVMEGGLVSSAVVGYTGRTFIYDGGTFTSNTIMENGIVAVSGGIVQDTVVSSAGMLAVLFDGTITGSLTIENGANVIFEGGVLDFDMRRLSVSADALVNNLALVTGTPSYTLMVNNWSPLATFKLAGGATGFDKTITVKNASGTELGTLTVGATLNVGDYGYTLNLDPAGLLSVTVSAAAPTTFIAKGDIDGNGVSDVLFQYTGGDYQLGYWMNGTNEWRGQGLAKPAVWEVLGSYDMNNNGKADSVLVGNVTTEIGGKGAYIGYYLDSVDADSNWQNIGYLNNEENIAWKNKVGNLTGNAGKNSIVWYAPELYALGVWTDGTTDWLTLGNTFGGSDWTLIGCGDFDGDGKDSVVMSYNNGQLIYTAGINESTKALGSANWSGWEIRAIGDFAGDGKDDIVLFHEDTGSMVMCANGNIDNYTSIGQLAPKDWFVVGAGDYNGDAKDDLLVRQHSTGMLGYYISGDQSQWVEMGRGVDMKWTVIA